MSRRRLLVAALVLAIIAVAGFIVFGIVIPGSEQSKTSGTLPAFTSQFGDIKTKAKTAAPTSTTGALNDGNGVKLASYVEESNEGKLFQGFQFTSCAELRGSTATPKAPATKAATKEALATEAASAATADASAAEPDFIVLRIVPEESEACYQVGEIFFNQRNAFNLAIGVTTAIVGEVAIDRANLSNSKVGDITVDISQLRSDDGMRDGRIRRDWLQSNKFPLAKLTEARAVGLPVGPFQDGELLVFQVIGMLQVREVKKEITFDVMASLTDDTLTGTATTDVKMTDFGFDPPSIAGMLRANDEVHIVFNFVAREPK